MAKVFVSYRRVASTEALLLVNTLRPTLRHTTIMLDVEDIVAGEDYFKRIENDVRACDIMLVLIDPRWLTLTEEDGTRRLDNPTDDVRREVEIALQHHVTVIPVLVGGATMPEPDDLPASMQQMCRMNASVLRPDRYNDDVARLVMFMRRNLPSRLFSFFDDFAEKSVAPYILSYVLITGLILFISRVLDIHQIIANVTVKPNFMREDTVIAKEVGLLLAVNWTVFVFLITPMLLMLFHGVLRDAKRLLQDMQLRRMIVYVDPNNRTTPISSRTIWASVLKPSCFWFAIMFGLGMSLGIFQWYQYSGQWYLNPPDKPEDFLSSFTRISTGVDWNIGWVASPQLAGDGLQITLFVLLFYLLYGIGWALTFSFYIFLFFFFGELENIAGATSESHEGLRLYTDDRESGGFGLFYRIQSQHAVFCTLSVVAMFLMSLRNSYLPHYCNAPKALQDMLGQGELLSHCASMVGFTTRLFYSSQVFLSSVWNGHPSWETLFYLYTTSNTFILGSAFQVGLIGAFFYYITTKMKSIVEVARQSSSEQHVGRDLLTHLGRQSTRNLLFIITGGLATIFLNLILIPLLQIIMVVAAEKIGMTRFKPRRV